ncbi:AraC family transcriptional regulator [Kitasatospora purpeofusca]|uniref:AraC family transcriptional regulator n=1 Tax=Kitasatospora purpeofusca TaxID=67352 RepID=A0ABZ1TVA6_9ACTN|nr:AraC family transcriptional regulator [Kitasatospora purpeofusca]
MAAPRSSPAPAPGTARCGDFVAETLELTAVRCTLPRCVTAAGAWALAFPAPGRLTVQAVLRGTVWLTVDDVERPVRLDAGEAAVLAGDRPYTLASGPEVPVTDAPPVDATAGPFLHAGAAGRDAVTLGGHLELDPAAEELLTGALPPVLRLGATTAEAPAVRWLLTEALGELSSDRPGASYALGHLAPLLLVQVLRALLAHGGADAHPAGLLRALADERLAPALRLMHGDPARPWTLAELARAAAMSRTSFAQRFKDLAGVPPLAYLRSRRMRLAQHTLRRTDTPLSTIAASLGYGSDSAFSTAFKRATGLSPRHYREAARSTPDRPGVPGTRG